ncbi:MAG: hypothetical protein B5M48_00250 [Candidatus Omnitrophica bacterium 4484_213]|nr:MAG: hypothetical protein B5M48_00250 [Candidatus Omnitrophica bacterium 4484_213]
MKIGFWKSLAQSFNPKFYKEIAKQSFGRSFKYLILFLLLVSLLIGGKFAIALKGGMQKAEQWINENLPGKIKEYLPKQMEIKNGELSVSAEQPFIKSENKEFAFVIDTTGQITSLDNYKNGLLITKTKMILKQTKPTGGVEIKEQDFAEIESLTIRRGDETRGEIVKFISPQKSFVLTYDLLNRWARKLWQIVFLPIFIFLFIYFLITKFLQLFLFSPVSLITNTLAKVKLQYKDLLNIGVYALTPATFLATLFLLFNVVIPAFGFIYVLIYSAFLVLGTLNCREIQGV